MAFWALIVLSSSLSPISIQCRLEGSFFDKLLISFRLLFRYFLKILLFFFDHFVNSFILLNFHKRLICRVTVWVLFMFWFYLLECLSIFDSFIKILTFYWFLCNICIILMQRRLRSVWFLSRMLRCRATTPWSLIHSILNKANDLLNRYNLIIRPGLQQVPNLTSLQKYHKSRYKAAGSSTS